MALRSTPSYDPRSPVVPDARGVTTVSSALRLVRAPAHAVYDFLERLPNHALITGDGLRLEGVAADGMSALISMRGPLGIRRTARTRVTTRRRPRAFGGTAEVGRRTVAYVHWAIEQAETGALVTLTATILRASALDRALLSVGGRQWLTRSFDRAVALLAVAVEKTAAAEETYARMGGRPATS
jgi:hypothetical protein